VLKNSLLFLLSLLNYAQINETMLSAFLKVCTSQNNFILLSFDAEPICSQVFVMSASGNRGTSVTGD
jgi:hypothetical protein